MKKPKSPIKRFNRWENGIEFLAITMEKSYIYIDREFNFFFQ